MIFQPYPILSEQEIKNLKEHKYSVTCSSLLDPYMQPFWNWFVTLVPLWVAPNLITIVGLAINLVTCLVLVYHCPTATEPAPWWATLSFAVGLFAYQLLDAIDGKQARRTGTSSPLGELFDHGCDSLSILFVTIGTACAVRMGLFPGWMLFNCLTTSALFYFAHWQTYVTGTLKFGTVDVTESQFIIIAVMLVSSVESFINIDIWTSTNIGFDEVTPLQIFMVSGMVIVIFHLAGTVPVCLNGEGSGRNGSTVAGTSVLSPSGPLLLVVSLAWVIACKSTQLIFHNQPLAYMFLFGLLCSKITIRLVVAHMCRGEITHRDSAMLAPLSLFLNQYFDTAVNEETLLYIALIWVILDLAWYCTIVCQEICSALGVSTFTIPYQRSKKESLQEKTVKGE